MIESKCIIRPKTKIDVYGEKLSWAGEFLTTLPVWLLYSPILIYHWVLHKLKPETNTIYDIDDSEEGVMGFHESRYVHGCFDTPVKLLFQFVDVSTIEGVPVENRNRFLVNFRIVSIRSEPENGALKDMLFTRSTFKYKGGVLLQRINTYNNDWELVYYDLTTNEEQVVGKFDEYFALGYTPKIENNQFIIKGDNGTQKITISLTGSVDFS